MISLDLVNHRAFEKALDEFPKRGYKWANRVLRGSVTELFRRILSRTPARTGRLRGGWRISGGGGASAFSELGIQEYAFGLAQRREVRMERDKVGTRTLARAKGTIDSLDLRRGDLSINIYNNVRYAKYVEFGTARMAPRGMLRTSVAEWPSIVRSRTALGGRLGGYGGGE